MSLSIVTKINTKGRSEGKKRNFCQHATFSQLVRTRFKEYRPRFWDELGQKSVAD